MSKLRGLKFTGFISRAVMAFACFVLMVSFNTVNADSKVSRNNMPNDKFGGLGMEVGYRNGMLTVIRPLEGSPAGRLGLKTGDVITHIEGEPTHGLTLAEAVDKMRGPAGTKITITVKRAEWNKARDFKVTREIIKISKYYSIYISQLGNKEYQGDFIEPLGFEITFSNGERQKVNIEDVAYMRVIKSPETKIKIKYDEYSLHIYKVRLWNGKTGYCKMRGGIEFKLRTEESMPRLIFYSYSKNFDPYANITSYFFIDIIKDSRYTKRTTITSQDKKIAKMNSYSCKKKLFEDYASNESKSNEACWAKCKRYDRGYIKRMKFEGCDPYGKPLGNRSTNTGNVQLCRSHYNYWLPYYCNECGDMPSDGTDTPSLNCSFTVSPY